MSTRRWLPVVGFEGLYRVSDDGIVESLPRVVEHAHTGSRALPGQPMRADVMEGGQRRVQLRRDGTRRHVLVHNLVLEAFVGPRPEGMEACHINGDLADNRATNLRWAPASASPRAPAPRGRYRKLNPQAVAGIRTALKLGASVAACARAAGVGRRCIRQVRDGETWREIRDFAAVTTATDALRIIEEAIHAE